ncbi:lysozyme [Rouxiella sp. S1S-2]|uniref:PKD domain-containing protein n=1 Tax=Rouxiella sp. S1S-2 TaxID=2653856 RepID=UPI0012645091|nr:glycosyl hydrolase family 18 protein [Rouxiella sp. S1S-2]KAB7897928.1 lysozyme [Rouxiella sp. S1S-2]
MKINKTTLGLLALGMICASTTVLASDLQAWAGQTAPGDNPIEVIFAGKVYKNVSWVGPESCPLTNSGPQYSGKPWLPVGDASKEDMENLGNPTTCDNADSKIDTHPETVIAAFDNNKDYDKGDKVAVNGVEYIALQDIPANSFAPSQSNPWVRYVALKEWQPSNSYKGGDKVFKDGEIYQAVFFSQGKDPSLSSNQSNGSNGKEWKPLGKYVAATAEQLAHAPELDVKHTYSANSLVKFGGVIYITANDVKGIRPLSPTPWRVSPNWGNTKELVGDKVPAWPAQFFAPYVDFAGDANNIADMANMKKHENISHYTLAFIVAKSANQCLPTWGTSYPVKNYAQYAKINALRKAGGDVMVSLGGAVNVPLASACKNADDLAQQYYDVVENLNLTKLDFDVEMGWSLDMDSIQRRNHALKIAQQRWQKEGRKVDIWYTLAVLPTGLEAGKAILQDAKKQGVDVAGVNLMTMDYGPGPCLASKGEEDNIQGQCGVDAVEATAKQLKQMDLFPGLSIEQIYGKIGSTPMIGYNDTQGEVFYLSDARLVLEDAKAKKLGMLSEWSVLRDKPGAIGNADFSASGLTEAQAPKLAFSQTFSSFASDSTNPVEEVHAVKANAGMQQNVNGESAIVLDGSKSTIKGGGVLTYSWKQVGGPDVILESTNTERATFNVAKPVQNARYEFMLTVTDGQQATSTDTVAVQVASEANPTAPVITLASQFNAISGKTAQVLATVSDMTPESEFTYAWRIPEELTHVTGTETNQLNIEAPLVTSAQGFVLVLTVTNNKTQLSTVATTTLIVTPAKTDDKPQPDDNIPQWLKTNTYAERCTKVKYQGEVWVNNNWAGPANVPGTEGEYGAWRKKVDGCK